MKKTILFALSVNLKPGEKENVEEKSNINVNLV
jgi:hypothetical protein